MDKLSYKVATKNDIPFINETYNENIESLHSVKREDGVWEELMKNKETEYYVVSKETPVAWFRLDIEDDGLWLGMLQVKPKYKRQGVGKYVLSVVEKIAKEKGMAKIGIHTTEDNSPAKSLYLSNGYEVTEIGPYTTADGVERTGYTFERQIN